jgi:hypothetical protein
VALPLSSVSSLNVSKKVLDNSDVLSGFLAHTSALFCSSCVVVLGANFALACLSTKSSFSFVIRCCL